MSKIKEKNVPLAIGLNVIFPGIGYMYMGKWIAGIIAALFVGSIYASTGVLYLMQTWIVINVIMAIDMIMISKKHKEKLIKENMKKCPSCAEHILKEAVKCRYCGTDLTSKSRVRSSVNQPNTNMPNNQLNTENNLNDSQEPSQSNGNVKRCVNSACNRLVGENQDVCIHCGTKQFV